MTVPLPHLIFFLYVDVIAIVCCLAIPLYIIERGDQDGRRLKRKRK